MLENKCDVHTHTLYSKHAYSTVLEDIHYAAEAGLELLGITDHFSRLTGTTYDLRDYQYFINMHMWPRELEGVKVLHGCEADIIDSRGHLFGYNIDVNEGITGYPYKDPVTLQNKVFEDCDYVIASVHNPFLFDNLSVEEATEMYISALNNPKVLFLGHSGRAGIKYDLDKVIAHAASIGKMIEINEHSFNYGSSALVCKDIARKCKELGCQVVVNTDAHIATATGHTPLALSMLEEINFPQELIATRSAEAFMAAMDNALNK